MAEATTAPTEEATAAATADPAAVPTVAIVAGGGPTFQQVSDRGVLRCAGNQSVPGLSLIHI